MIYQKLMSLSDAGGWDVSTAVFNQEFAITTGPTTSEGIFFKPDGTKMFIASNSRVYEYNLSTPWTVSTASSVTDFTVSSETVDAESLHFSGDGSKMYVSADPFFVYQYSLSTAWDVSTASFTTSLNIGGPTDDGVESSFLRQDGLKLYILRVSTGVDTLDEYDLSTAFNVSTGTLLRTQSITFSGDAGGIFFKPDGKKLFISEWGSPGKINEYALTSAWDVSTTSFTQSFLLSDERFPEDVFFRQDGRKMYVLGDDDNKVVEYDIS